MMIGFVKTAIKAWKGRYAHIPKSDSVFHLKWIDDKWWPTILWRKDDLSCICPAVSVPGVQELAYAVSQAKQHFGSTGGGSFVINEFGQVIVPSSAGNGKRAVVGEWRGELLFTDPETECSFSLSDDSYLICGDRWLLPDLGMKYQLSGRSQIYFYRDDDKGGRTEYPLAQDEVLVKKLRSIRRTGPIRLAINLHGVVTVKRPIGDNWSQHEEWVTVYIGRIDSRKWFRKES